MAEAVAISVVIPVYNEVKTIGEVIRRVLDCGYETEVVVVDDASSDGTRDYLKQLENPKGALLLSRRKSRQGRGAEDGFCGREKRVCDRAGRRS